MSKHPRYIEENPSPTFFKVWREYRDMTQVEVEQLYNWPASRVSNIENGRAIVTDHVLRALARAYRCTPGDLLDRPPPSSSMMLLKKGRGGSSAELGLGALHVALSALHQVGVELKSMRTDIGRRLDGLEGEIARVDSAITEALRDSVDLAESLQRTAGNITRALSLQPANGDDEPPEPEEDA